MRPPSSSDPSRRCYRFISPWLLIILSTVVGTVAGVLSFVLLYQTRSSPETNHVTIRLKRSVQNIQFKVVGDVSAQSSLSSPSMETNLTIPVTSPRELSWAKALQAFTNLFLRLHHWLQRFVLYRNYGWAILPFIVVAAMHINTHLYYDTFRGYDMPPHFNNMFSIMRTGMLPPVISLKIPNSGTYEAYQSPLFYTLTAWIGLLGERVRSDGYAGWIPSTLFLLSVVWSLVMIVVVEKMLRRTSPILKGLTLCIVMLLPVNVLMAAMYNNDLPATILILVGILILWVMLRSGRQLDRALWIRFGAIAGISIAFKNNGVILLGVSILLAGYISFLYLLKHRYGKMMRVILAIMICLPMMLVPYIINVIHTIDYTGNQYGAVIPRRPIWGNLPITFFTTFDTTIFEKPYAFGPGENSYWSLQYVTMHQDYYNHWYSPSFNQVPLGQLVELGYFDYIPLTRYNNAVVLQYLAIPITLIMVFGFFASLYQVIRRPYRALRDGSILIVLLAVVTEVAQFLRFSDYGDVHAVIIHARFLSFMFMVLFIGGIGWLWRLLAYQRWQVTAVTSLAMLAYCYVAYQLLWLPPV